MPYSLELLQPWIDQARRKGIRSLAFTDHDRYRAGIDFAVVEQLRERNPDVQILAGLELDNDPATSLAGFRWVEENWDRLDFVLGSVHYLPGETQMFDAPDQAGQIEMRGADRAYAEYLGELERLMRRGCIDCLAHLDLVKIHGHKVEEGDAVARFRPVLELAKRSGLAIEASTAGWRKTVREQYPQVALLAEVNRFGLPITTASDAHSHVQVAADYDRLSAVLNKANVSGTVTYSRHRPISPLPHH